MGEDRRQICSHGAKFQQAARARICHGIRLHGTVQGNLSSLSYSRYPVAIPTDTIDGNPTSTNDVVVTSTLR